MEKKSGAFNETVYKGITKFYNDFSEFWKLVNFIYLERNQLYGSIIKLMLEHNVDEFYLSKKELGEGKYSIYFTPVKDNDDEVIGANVKIYEQEKEMELINES